MVLRWPTAVTEAAAAAAATVVAAARHRSERLVGSRAIFVGEQSWESIHAPPVVSIRVRYLVNGITRAAPVALVCAAAASLFAPKTWA
jgi:hypothetical protein